MQGSGLQVSRTKYEDPERGIIFTLILGLMLGSFKGCWVRPRFRSALEHSAIIASTTQFLTGLTKFKEVRSPILSRMNLMKSKNQSKFSKVIEVKLSAFLRMEYERSGTRYSLSL